MRYIIDGLPRTGSTTLANILTSNTEGACLIEPFHPGRYNGDFLRLAKASQSVIPVLDLIWRRWSGIKHVWESETTWPFQDSPQLNDELVLAADRVILLRRRNLLHRCISERVSKQLKLWIGTKAEFVERLKTHPLRTLEPTELMVSMKADYKAMIEREALLNHAKLSTMCVFYEDLYGEDITPVHQFTQFRDIVKFLNLGELSESDFVRRWIPLLDPEIYKWSSASYYNNIPELKAVEREMHSFLAEQAGCWGSIERRKT